MSRTKDEKYIVCLYETAMATGGLNQSVNVYRVGEKAGISKKGVDAICRLLAQANFIKLADQQAKLTPHGKKLVEDQLL